VLKNHRGELYIFLGALTFSVNGIVSTVVLEELSAFRLAQIRAISAFILLFIFALIFRRDLIRLSKKDVPLAITY
jgi:drug/metabolite transporter (DMT)-like permease